MKKLLIGLALLTSISSFATPDIASCVANTYSNMDGGFSFGITRSQVLNVCKLGVQDCATALYNEMDGGFSFGITAPQALDACSINSTPDFVSCASTYYNSTDGGFSFGSDATEAISLCAGH